LRHLCWGAAVGLGALALTFLPATAGADQTINHVAGALTSIRSTTSAASAVDALRDTSPKLQYQLGVLARTTPTARRAEARRLFVPLRAGALKVEIETTGRPNTSGLEAVGAHVVAQAGRFVSATVPPAALSKLAALREVQFVRMPSYRVLDDITGEEVKASNASASIQKGWTGKGVKIAILDGGFTGYQQRIDEGELPSTLKTKNFCPTGGFAPTFSGGEHGTAVAEIVHEMAPSAQLYLICSEDQPTLAQAEQYAKSQGVKVISHSASVFNDGRGDGSPTPGSFSAVVADARQSGILWINSAGNSGQRHWSGVFTDPDGNGFENFQPTTEGNGVLLDHNQEFCAFLRWDEWPAAVDDFDLVLVTQTFQVLTASATRQTGTQPPTEQLCYQNTGAAGTVYLAIYAAHPPTTPPRLDLYTIDTDLQWQVPAGSIGDPGSSPFSFTAGAICWQDSSLEPYSGQGPTIDNRVKPDIAGQDANSGATYGKFTGCGSNPAARTGFFGTSASAPAVAGAAALVLEENPGFTADQTQVYLQQNAADLGVPGPDNQFGSGRLTVPTPATVGPTLPDTVPPVAKAIKSTGVRGKSVKLYIQASDNSHELRLVDIVKRGTRKLATLPTPFTTTKAGATYYLVWKAPATLTGTLAHCVQAFDHAGNQSKISCAPLILKKK
jgi:subtilisin family serine protease